MFTRLKLRSRILIGYLVPIPLSCLIAGLVYSNNNQVQKSMTTATLVRDLYEVTDVMELRASAIERATRGYLLMPDITYVEVFNQSAEKLNEVIEATESLAKKPEASFLTTEEKKNIADNIALSRKLLELDRKMIALATTNKKAEALQIFRSDETSKIINKINQLNDRLNVTLKQHLQTQDNFLSSSIALVNNVALIGTLVSALIALSFGLLIAGQISKTIKDSISIIAASATEIATTIEEQERVAVQQAASVNETTTSMDQLGASSRQSAEQAAAAAAGSRHVLALAIGEQEGDLQSHRNRVTLQEKMEQVQSQILRLSEHLSQIYTITNAVSDLASQTNMLALNASVEAVRAGEHGKGFGVVAIEIRKLADQSRRSAEKINSLIGDIQNATNSTVIVTEEGTKAVEEIVSAINEVTVNIQQISLNAKQQALAVQQVVEAMNGLNTAAQQTATSINQTKVGTQQLNQTALNLQSLI
ncbi:MAG: methyl-accepting chemotaxis protein [Actinomycetota bacterium]